MHAEVLFINSQYFFIGQAWMLINSSSLRCEVVKNFWNKIKITKFRNEERTVNWSRFAITAIALLMISAEISQASHLLNKQSEQSLRDQLNWTCIMQTEFRPPRCIIVQSPVAAHTTRWFKYNFNFIFRLSLQSLQTS